jgi:putative transposase
MLRFRRMKSLQKFASAHANVHNPFNHERHFVDRQICKERRSAALTEWCLVVSHEAALKERVESSSAEFALI